MYRTVFLIGGLALSGCGGGGAPTQTPVNIPAVELANSPATVDLQDVLTVDMTAGLFQVLAMQSTSVDIDALARTELTSNWRDADQLKYVMIGAHGDILGQSVPELPNRANFSATGAAQLAVTTRSDAYVLQQGDVSATLDMSQPKVAVDLRWTDNDITYVSETPMQSSPSVFSANITTTLHGGDVCVADSLFCGGRLVLSTDTANAFENVEMSPENLSIGFYGTSSQNAEMGGRVVYINDGELSVIGGFIAAQTKP